ncbi:MAG: aconitate hydratase [Elusimicrobiaceae bacterium]|jgi:aconitate hydratase|nr:aconitate hydratase [Elusimicrobiaceae bacterium]MBT3955034.1 aconitate hydratase [Elusimicrobiaceae bacterium]MBT4008074.1 aconitate hydratase [Elusimicrobiaceae bacterium]MBT4402730.1 aconitate hydratase [Elusimicrobiaceae bacterium]MBT4439986.1 aconitate hydratase [Elusimicrobiaceae bacterium]
MPKNIVEKVLQQHLKEGEYIKGKEIGIRMDQTLTQDATGTMAYLQFEALGMTEVKTDLSVSYVDHNTVQVGFENNDDHLYLKSVAEKFGVVYSRAGNGICHQVHLERFGKPGTTLVGSDSHTPTGGGVGQIAIGAGGLDVAVAMGGGNFYLTCPKVYKVNLTGKLKPWISAKDVILKMLSILSTKGNVGVIIEYGGEGIKTLSVPQRATITNMGAEMGVTTSIFPSDEITKQFLKAQDREGDYIELSADENAEYDKVIDINLSEVEPLAAAPHSPGNVVTIKEIEGMKVDQVCIGSCTNSSYRDMMIVASILKDKTVAENTSLGIAAGSRQVIQMLTKNGAMLDLVNSGARILESACGFCIGNSFSPKSGAVSARTSNRNFEGRSGTKDAQAYLVSPEIAALAAIHGKFISPENAGEKYPEISEPDTFLIDDRMFLNLDKAKKEVDIFRGPNIGNPPSNDKMPEALNGSVMIKVGDKITTDHIMPAGPRLKYRSNIKKYSEFVFENIDKDFWKKCLENKEQGGHNIIVAGDSYGQGSSREHAAMCPMYLGVKAVVVKNLERIHAANLVNFGILPLMFENAEDYDKIEAGDKLEAPTWKEDLKNGKNITLKNTTKGVDILVKYELSDRQKDMVLEGGLLNYTTGK